MVTTGMLLKTYDDNKWTFPWLVIDHSGTSETREWRGRITSGISSRPEPSLERCLFANCAIESTSFPAGCFFVLSSVPWAFHMNAILTPFSLQSREFSKQVFATECVRLTP